jgi:threonine/homoserine/homoserine lactone efflux protein
MPIIYLLEGIVVGFFLATPIGPIGILCVRHSLVYGHRHGLVVGLGGATGDIVYATVAVFGVSLISSFIIGHQQAFRISGGVFLLLAGFYTLRSSATASVKVGSLALHAKVFLSTFLLAITNPVTLFGFIAVFTVIGVRRILLIQMDVAALVVGIFIGSFLWFLTLTSLAHRFREKLTSVGLKKVNKIAGSLLMLFGVAACLGGLGLL